MAPVKEASDMTLAQLYDLSGKVAVVTGGAKGIGQGIADRLAEAGATVLVVDIDADGAQAAAGAIEQRGGTASSAVADLSTADGANAAVATAIERYGRIDILVNNAGIYPMVPALQLSEEVWD
ncbi:MAG: SDR family NAD(P)-dependent oxidoreductase, partial [Acidobacteria bacterium]|nr:SDR family NAD(P)-dependent oxidoreductase [Acidobacteriota bacterium]